MKGFRLVALCGCIAAAAIGLAACGGSSTGETIAVNPKKPQELLEDATVHGVHSGQTEVIFILTNRSKDEALTVRPRGYFKGLGEGGLPQFDMTVGSSGHFNGHKVDFTGSMVLLPTRAGFVYGKAYRELPYRTDKATLEALKSEFEEAQEEGGEGDVMACVRAAEGVGLPDLIHNVKREGDREYSDGTRVFLVGGDLDLDRLIDVLVQMAEDPACGAQMSALGLPSAPELKATKVFLKGHLKEARAIFSVNKHGQLYDLGFHMAWKSPRGDSMELKLEFRLRVINTNPEIYFFSEGESLDALLRKFGTNAETALRVGGAEAVIGFLRGFAGGMTGRLPAEGPR